MRSTKIVKHFKDRVPSKDMALFKKLLKEIFVLRKESGEGEWVLKLDYQLWEVVRGPCDSNGLDFAFIAVVKAFKNNIKKVNTFVSYF